MKNVVLLLVMLFLIGCKDQTEVSVHLGTDHSALQTGTVMESIDVDA